MTKRVTLKMFWNKKNPHTQQYLMLQSHFGINVKFSYYLTFQ